MTRRKNERAWSRSSLGMQTIRSVDLACGRARPGTIWVPSEGAPCNQLPRSQELARPENIDSTARRRSVDDELADVRVQIGPDCGG